MGLIDGIPTFPNARRMAYAAITCAFLCAVMIVGTTGVAAAADSRTPVRLAYAVPGPSSSAGMAVYPTPFTRTAFRTVDATLFPKWHDAIVRTDQQLNGTSAVAISSEHGRRSHDIFNRIVAQVAAKSGLDRLAAVNDLIDAVPYRTDREVYGVSDYWATPIEMLASAGGDCEDHAIAKLTVLKQAGMSEDSLRLVVGIDTATGKAHAMAVAEWDGVAYALDGRTNRVIAWGGAELRFKPLYAAGFHKAWIYRS